MSPCRFFGYHLASIVSSQKLYSGHYTSSFGPFHPYFISILSLGKAKKVDSINSLM